MAKAAEVLDKSIWQIFFEGLKIYCFNFPKFFLYMAFPVFGQLIGLVMTFGMTHLFSKNLPDLIMKYPFFDNFTTIILCVILLTIPGLLIWAKAFWDFIVAYVALNSMTEGALTTGRVYDFKSHNQVVTQRIVSFILLWLLFGIFTLLAVFPLFWVLGFIFFIYFILIFQVFTFEQETSPIGCFKKSLMLIKGNFSRTFLLMFILGFFTYYLLTVGVSVLFDVVKLTNPVVSGLEGWVNALPLEPLYEIYAKVRLEIGPTEVARSLKDNLILFLVIGMTLPLRSACWTLWYKNLNTDTPLKKTPVKRKSRELKDENKGENT